MFDTELRSMILGFVRKRVRDPFEAEDLTQSILAKAHRRLGTLRETTRFHQWIFRIARRAVIDHYRRSANQPPTAEAAIEPTADRHRALTREEERFHAELIRYVREVVESLPEPYRSALIATEYKGMTQTAYAEREGITVPAAKSRVQRARKKMREQMERCCQWETDQYGAVIDCREKATDSSCQ